MSEDYHDRFLTTTLRERAEMAGLRPKGATVSEFIAALPKSSLLGAELPKEIETFLDCYTRANLAGGRELEKFTADVTARLPDNFFETRLVPDEEQPTVGDVVWLARTAVAILGLTANGEKDPCTDLSKLPLAV